MKGTTVKKTQKIKSKNKKPEQTWQERVAALPVMLFHTTLGPIIGRVETAPASDPLKQFRTRVWAPAIVQIAMGQAVKGEPVDHVIRQRVVFQPMALIETHIDLSSATPAGTSPVPQSVLPGYEEYFAKFVSGEYALSRTVAKIEQAAPHVVESEEPAAPMPNGTSEPEPTPDAPSPESDNPSVS